ISWDEVRRTAKLGVTFGPHTVTHPILSLATDQACRWEIEESYRRVRQETDAWVPVFCYPNGEPRAFGQRELEATQHARFRVALTTVRDYAAARHLRAHGALGRFALPRFPYPDDRPHLVHFVSGLLRLKRMLLGRSRTMPSEVTPRLAALSATCAGLLALSGSRTRPWRSRESSRWSTRWPGEGRTARVSNAGRTACSVIGASP